MTEHELRGRTKKFALPVMKLVEELPETTVGRAIGSQLSNYQNLKSTFSNLKCEL